MNELTKTILTEVLQSDDAWEKKTRRLRLHYVVDEYAKAREALWLDDVYFPRMFRLFRALRTWRVFPESAFVWESYGVYRDDLAGWWLADQCAWEIFEERQETNKDAGRGYFSASWWSEKWGYEIFTEADVLALDIRPHLVPARVGQPSMF